MVTTLNPGAAADDGWVQLQAPRFRVWMCDPWCRTPWYTAALAQSLQASGHRVRLVCPSYHLEPDYFRAQGLRPQPGAIDIAARCGRIVAPLLRPARLAEYGVNTVALKWSARARPPQIVHHQQCVLLERGWKSELRFLGWLRARGISVVYTVHNLLPHRQMAFHEEIHAELYRIPDALICHDSESARALHEQFGVEQARIHVIPHGPLFDPLPSLTLDQCRDALRIPRQRQVYLALGVLSPYKGLDLLLEAWADLVRKDRGVQRPLLIIAGNGPEIEKTRLRQWARGLGLGRETLRLDLDYIPSSRLPFYLHAADVLLYPYRETTTSGALLTGLNYCKPIVASDLPAFRGYLQHGANALVVPRDDRGALAQAMFALRDEDLCAQLNAGSRNNTRLQVQWDEIAARTAQLYACAAA